MDTSFYDKKRPVPILTQDNHEDWFEEPAAYLEDKDLWAVVTGTSMEADWKRKDGKSVVYNWDLHWCHQIRNALRNASLQRTGGMS